MEATEPTEPTETTEQTEPTLEDTPEAEEVAAATEEMAVTLRGPIEGDRPYLASTWLANYRHDGCGQKYIDKNVFFANHRILVNRLLDQEGVVVLCPTDFPSHILGFAVGRVYKTAILLHYVYVKERLRNKGLARFLLGPFGWEGTQPRPIIATHRTWVVNYLQNKFPIGYNPYLLWQEYRKHLDVTEAGVRPKVR